MILLLVSNLDSEFLPPELDDWLSPNYEAKGSKRLRSSKSLIDNDWFLVKCGSGLLPLCLAWFLDSIY